MDDVPSLGGGIFPFPALVVDFLPFFLLPVASCLLVVGFQVNKLKEAGALCTSCTFCHLCTWRQLGALGALDALYALDALEARLAKITESPEIKKN